jgi:sodium/bile acid cotransporter 7
LLLFLAIMKRYLPDTFTWMLLSTVLLATLLPATGRFEDFMHLASNAAIALLFFLHGARLSREAALSGFKQPRLHLLTLACTFVLFPLLGLALQALFPGLLTPELWLGVLFVCTLSSTVQSSIAFTSIARGNVPAAICGATASNLLGIVFTPILVTLLLHRHHDGGGLQQVSGILLQLLLPFVLGNVLRPWIGDWVLRKKGLLAVVDRGGILLAVYAAFSVAVAQGVWHLFPPQQLALLVLVNAILLGGVLTLTTFGSRALGFARADEIMLVFCGSKKSLASGIPMASVLFSSSGVGIVLLPIMVFHQMQLMLCAVLARRYAERQDADAAAAEGKTQVAA